MAFGAGDHLVKDSPMFTHLHQARVLLIATLLLYSAHVGYAAPAQKPDVLVAAPQWHMGQWWRVKVSQMTMSSTRQDIHDSATDYSVYRYLVAGKRTLTFERQDGKDHVGQAVPPEVCWLVVITLERTSQPIRSVVYHLYFRAEDLSLREVAEPGGRLETYYDYVGTSVNDDDQTKPVVALTRGPYHATFGPPVLDWPGFPLTADSVPASGTRKVTRITPLSGDTSAGAEVALRDGTDVTTQIWRPGFPWWVSANRNGLQKSQLIETSDQSLSGKPKL